MHRSRALAFTALALLAAPAGLAAQHPPAPRAQGREIVNWDFRRDGAFRKQALQVRQGRRAALARGDIQALNAPSPAAAVTGDFKLPVVFLQYTDSAATAPMSDTSNYHSVFFSADPAGDPVPRPYSLKTYYEDQSNGQITMDGTFYGWVTTPYTFSYVGSGCAGIYCSTGQQHLAQMFAAALDSLSGVDWSQYDSDNDGYVDFVTFVLPTRGAECLGKTVNNVWAHRYALSGLRRTPYITTTDWVGHSGVKIRIDDYVVQSGQGGNTGCTSGEVMPMGTVAHETGHAFGIPDLYDTSGETEGIGEWGLMGAGNYARPYSPSSLEAWSRAELGWVTVDTLSGTQTVELGPVETSDTVLLAGIAGSDQYVLIENRQGIENDSAMMNVAFARPKSPGLLLWQVDQSIMTAGAAGNTVNAGAIKGLRLLQADGLRQLDSAAASNRGDTGDSYPGSTNNRRLGYTTNPSARSNEGGVAGFVIDSIYQVSADGPMTFRFIQQAPFVVTTDQVANGATVTVNNVTAATYQEILANGDTAHVTVADTQLVNGAKTKLAFSAWSDGQARTHTITSDGAPDTITAQLDVLHKVTFTANGSGSVSGFTSGNFQLAGSTVTLTATADSGALFTGWSGDTTTSNATLQLPMQRPYNVVASFSGAVTVSEDSATRAILGLVTLTAPQKAYLDGLGNNNGVYDLGDYLAFLKSEGLVAAPQALQRILSARPAAPSQER
ncbi:MAG TPA: M6 family metalloprotease domain-containing protein [Gemmatimonadales bacterium]|nr:M6 family metalloprotease domain-containing protein [Gemmatimonadales bacterium]